MTWLGEFFSTLPTALSALWNFQEGGLYNLVVTVVSGAMVAVFLFLAVRLRDDQGWLSATFGTMGATVVAYWLFGILPSAWIYYADGQRNVLEGPVIPKTVGLGSATISANFYQVFRDIIVVTETGIAVGAMGAAALWIQKRYPRTLSEGESSRSQSGGYK